MEWSCNQVGLCANRRDDLYRGGHMLIIPKFIIRKSFTAYILKQAEDIMRTQMKLTFCYTIKDYIKWTLLR